MTNDDLLVLWSAACELIADIDEVLEDYPYGDYDDIAVIECPRTRRALKRQFRHLAGLLAQHCPPRKP